MRIVLALIVALASSGEHAPMSPRTLRAVGWEYVDDSPTDKIVWRNMTSAEYRDWYGAEITKILDLHRKRKSER